MADYEPLGNVESPEPFPRGPEPPPPPADAAAPAPPGGEYEVPNFGQGILGNVPPPPERAAPPPPPLPAELDEETDLRSLSQKEEDRANPSLSKKKQSKKASKGSSKLSKDDSDPKRSAGKLKKPKNGISRDVGVLLVITSIGGLVMCAIAYGFLHFTENLTKDIFTVMES